MIDTATFRLSQEELLAAVWYSDGSGARGYVGIEDTYDGWKITKIELLAGEMVKVTIKREDDE